jgi:nicotinamide-nucleotide amidase
MDELAPLATRVIETCLESGLTLSVAESCTGGLICHELTNVPGSSGVLLAGVVAYTDGAKREILGVERELLEEHGAIHDATGAAMAEGVRRICGADFGLAVTGAAGPGSPPGIPVGTVIVAVVHRGGCDVRTMTYEGGRARVRMKGAEGALDILLEHIGQPDTLTGRDG